MDVHAYHAYTCTYSSPTRVPVFQVATVGTGTRVRALCIDNTVAWDLGHGDDTAELGMGSSVVSRQSSMVMSLYVTVVMYVVIHVRHG